MDDQIIIGVDEAGNLTGEYFPKAVGHTGEGKKHLAITVLVYRRKSTRSPYNSKQEVLAQRRKHQIFDNIWDLTASTHPLHSKDGFDESAKDATKRALKDEWGIEKLADLEEVGGFSYFAQIGSFCENEFDILFIAKYEGEIKLNKDVAYEYKWIERQAFLQDIEQNPEKYSKWAKESVKLLKKKGFFRK